MLCSGAFRCVLAPCWRVSAPVRPFRRFFVAFGAFGRAIPRSVARSRRCPCKQTKQEQSKHRLIRSRAKQGALTKQFSQRGKYDMTNTRENPYSPVNQIHGKKTTVLRLEDSYTHRDFWCCWRRRGDGAIVAATAAIGFFSAGHPPRSSSVRWTLLQHPANGEFLLRINLNPLNERQPDDIGSDTPLRVTPSLVRPRCEEKVH